MFNFLNTTVLFAAVAALIPLIIHLFSKRKINIVDFSSLKHLKAMQRRQVRRLKIRQILLLILRMLIILIVVLAFARPTTRTSTVGSHAAVSAVILFDNSASMDRYVADGNLFDLAKRRADQLMQTFGESDEISLLSTTDQNASEQFPSFTSASVAREKLQRLTQGYSRENIQTSLNRALILLADAVNLNKEIYIFSDRQSASLPDSNIIGDNKLSIYLIDLPLETNDDCGIVSVDFGGQLIVPGHDFTLTATVRNYSGSDRDDLIASLFLDGNRIAQTDFQIPAGEETSVRFARAVSTTGLHSGYIELSDDKFLGDNRYYFSFRIPERLNLLIIDGDQTGGLISLALAPSESVNQYWSVKRVAPESLSGVNFYEYDIIVLSGAPPLPETYVQRLKSFVNRGNSLLVTYDGDTDIEYFNNTWSELTGIVYDAPLNKDFSRAGYYSLTGFEIDHPVFSVFAFENNRPPEIKFYTLPTLHLRPSANVLMRFTGDRPAMVETTYGGGKVMTLTGPISPRYSDIAGRAFFVPFISRIAEYLASDLSSYDLRLFCGNNISRSIAQLGSVNAPIVLKGPDSSEYALIPEEDGTSPILRISETTRPGLYRIRYKDRDIDLFALNIDPAECDLSAVDNDQFAAALGSDEMRVIENGADIASIITQFRYGRELWHILMWIAAGLIFVEILLSRGATSEETA